MKMTMKTETENEKKDIPIKEEPPLLLKGFPIVRGRQITPLKGLIYGYNGVGKSTFAACSKAPIFLDLEGNVDHLDIDKIPLDTLEKVEACLDSLLTESHTYATVVIDSIDKLELFITHYLNRTKSKKELEYGRSYVFTAEHFQSILEKLDDLREKRNMNVVLIGHSTVKRCENPTAQVYDKYVLRVSEKSAAVIGDWSHFILFAVNDLSFEQQEELGFKKTRERVIMNDRRILYTMGNTAYTAKNPYGLPRIIPLKWNDFIEGVKKYYATTSEGENK